MTANELRDRIEEITDDWNRTRLSGHRCKAADMEALTLYLEWLREKAAKKGVIR